MTIPSDLSKNVYTPGRVLDLDAVQGVEPVGCVGVTLEPSTALSPYNVQDMGERRVQLDPGILGTATEMTGDDDLITGIEELIAVNTEFVEFL